MSVTVHGIPGCDTVKKARDWLDGQGIAFTFHEVATDKVVWSGWKIAKGTNQNAPQVMVKRAPGYTKDIFAKYPPK